MFSLKKNKIIASILVVLVTVVTLASVSFSTKVSNVSSSFTSTTSVVTDSKTRVVEAVANIEVAALTASIVDGIEDNLESETVGIYNARQEEEAAVAEAKALAAARTVAEEAVKSEATVVAGANLNGLEAEVLRLINSVRADHGLSQLVVLQSLTDISRTRSSDMVQRGYFSHYSPEGSTFFNIMRNNGISWSNAGENLGNAAPANWGTPSAFINAWMNSASHRDNMLRGHYKYIGVGIVDGGGRRVITTIFLN